MSNFLCWEKYNTIRQKTKDERLPFDVSFGLRYNPSKEKFMPTPNPAIAAQLQQAKDELARLKAEKLGLFPPNPHPFAQDDAFPKNATPQQIKQRNELVARIEELERRIEELKDRLYTQ